MCKTVAPSLVMLLNIHPEAHDLCFSPLHFSTSNSTQVSKWECKLIQMFQKVLPTLFGGLDRLHM